MSCNDLLTAGIPKGCRGGIGGLKRVLLANQEMISSLTPTADNDVTGITAITMATNPLTSSAYTFFEFIPKNQSSNAVQNIQSNGSFVQEITLIFEKQTAILRNQIKLMAQSTLVAIVEDYNGLYWYYGEFMGLELTAGNGQTGTAITDMNGWTLTLTGPAPVLARTVESSVITTLGFTA